LDLSQEQFTQSISPGGGEYGHASDVERFLLENYRDSTHNRAVQQDHPDWAFAHSRQHLFGSWGCSGESLTRVTRFVAEKRFIQYRRNCRGIANTGHSYFKICLA